MINRWLSSIRYTLPGSVAALVFVCLSFTPSLIPRSGLFQGLLAGASGAIGYGLGVFGAWIWRAFADREAREPQRRSWVVYAVVAPLALGVSFGLGMWWQSEIRDLMGITGGGSFVQRVLVPVVGAVVFILFIGIGRGLRRLYRALVKLLDRWIGARAASATGWVIVAGGAFLAVSGLITDIGYNILDRSFQVANEVVPENITQPTSATRSGSPDSLIEWETLGREGRKFVASGPSPAGIRNVVGRPAQEPIRAFAGVESADEVEERAALAVDDLERAGGFERSNLFVITTTGSGWVDPASVDTIEYLTAGDSATVAMQYSYLPSWVSYLADQEKAREAGRELFDAVYGRWLTLPEGERPNLYVAGESLGSYGAEFAFSGEFDLANRVDGAVFAGPPNFNPLYRRFTDNREPGTREVAPIYKDGRVVRFDSDTSAPPPPAGQPWDESRVLYLLHPSDPIVWWSPDLILDEPAWLREPRGSDVLPESRWAPFVTFFQVSADLAVATAVPAGHGHRYSGEYVDAWMDVLRSDVEAEDAQLIRDIVTGRPNPPDTY
jgi:uncharacterized membrane protein